jgi:hypothetical protein
VANSLSYESERNVFDYIWNESVQSMVATQVGVQKISGITLYAVQEKKLYEPLSDIEIFVDAE